MKRFATIALVMLLAGCPKHITGAFVAPVPYSVPVIGYKVYRGTSRTNMEPIFTVQTEKFQDTTADTGTVYYYKVTAVYADGSESDSSNLACGTTAGGQVQCQ